MFVRTPEYEINKITKIGKVAINAGMLKKVSTRTMSLFFSF